MNIAILITTFLRDDLLYDTLQTIVDNYIDNSIVFVADQGNIIPEKTKKISEFQSKIPLKYYPLDFDCGLSYSRNYLVKEAYNMNIPYCLLSADSIQFTKKYDFSIMINFLEESKKRAIVGFDLKNRTKWEFTLTLNNGFELNLATEEIEYKGIKLKKVDICRNFFLAKTNVLIENQWDNELKMCEHEDFFWRLKNVYEVYFTDYICANYKKFVTDEYLKYRNRLYGEYRELLKQKYNIRQWIKYGKGVGIDQ